MNNNNGNFGMINLDNLDKVRSEQEKNNKVENNNNNTNYNANNNYNPSQNTFVNPDNVVYYNEPVNNTQVTNNEEKAPSKLKENFIFTLVILSFFLIIGMIAAVVLLKTGVISNVLKEQEQIEISKYDEYAYISRYTGEYSNGAITIKIIRTGYNEIDVQYMGVDYNGYVFMGANNVSSVNDSELQVQYDDTTYKIRFSENAITLSSVGDDERSLTGTYTHKKSGEYMSIDGMYINNGLSLYVTQLGDSYDVSIIGTVENGNKVKQRFTTTDNNDEIIEFTGLNFITKIDATTSDLLVTTENKEVLTFKLCYEK